MKAGVIAGFYFAVMALYLILNIILKINLHMKNLNYSIKIERIVTNLDKTKLIAFSKVFYYSKCKPQISPAIFADYNNNILKVYTRNEFQDYKANNFKEALRLIREKLIKEA